MPPKLAEVEAQPLVIPFEVPLRLRDASGKPMGEYKMQESGDPQLYPGTFAEAPACQTMTPLVLTRQQWESLSILQDEPVGASISVAEMMPERSEQLEPGELVPDVPDDASVAAGSVASQKQEEVVVEVVAGGNEAQESDGRFPAARLRTQTRTTPEGPDL